jgi:hypothetical protein
VQLLSSNAETKVMTNKDSRMRSEPFKVNRRGNIVAPIALTAAAVAGVGDLAVT